jgi:hypothetical protein
MHDHGIPSTRAIQRAILSLALDAYPKPITYPVLYREIGRGGDIVGAVYGLIDMGLLKVSRKQAIQPTPAALYFHRLDLP